MTDYKKNDSSILVLDKESGKRTVAACDFAEGDIVMFFDATIAPKQDMHTIQLEPELHVVSKKAKFVNHSCMPNTMVCTTDKTFVAIRDIEEGEEITFNYNTTEYELSSPFLCLCNSNNCYTYIKGFKYLNSEEILEIKPYLAEHLKLFVETGCSH